MLTSETKQRINTCRDILVGKLPDPKSQVLQITNALIYKFMDDQDRLAEKLGGKPSFFINGLKPSAWHKLFDAKLTNQERGDKYIEAIQKLSQAKHLPELFQEIFKEAFVPFRDARVITLFISEINKFDYTHSEELGNAYEYLLSIMGSQGDAGQFRTPRHIIEFLVDVVDPQKGETIYDPAAGTAGFLISAYNHIAQENEKLSATDKRRLATNISGIDISPDMAKMARVNLYLHGFTTPNISEGDTLTDEHLWGKKFDVILANPPFMSPKGGIQPHGKFSITAKRSEILFVDYIAEHLKLKGRAGIIVPEGIIFQSGTAYKKLRKMLVEDGYLHTVISLPGGIFQPYSGVKTSMLILDRERAKAADEILFLKIEKDGYSLSTQRTKLCNDNGEEAEWCPNHSDLPLALEVAQSWRNGGKQEASIANWVSKKEIAESGEYNLSAERYQKTREHNYVYSLMALGDMCTINPSKREALQLPSDTHVSFVPMADLSVNYVSFTPKEVKQISDIGASYTYFENGDVLLAKVTPCFENGKAAVARELVNGIGFGSSEFYVLRPNDKVLSEFLFYCLKHRYFREAAIAQMTGTGGLQRVPKSFIQNKKLPLPPLEVQQEIVAELDRYQKIIDGARQVVENYKPSFGIDPSWEVTTFANEGVLQIIDGDRGVNYPKKEEFSSDGHCLFLNTSNVRDGRFNFDKCDFISTERDSALRKGKLIRDDIALTTRGTLGNTALYSKEVDFEHIRINSGMVILRTNSSLLDPSYLLEHLNSLHFHQQVQRFVTGSAQPQLPIRILSQISLPLPPLEAQKRIVGEIRAEKDMVNNSQNLINHFEAKIKATIDRVWGQEAPRDECEPPSNELL